MGQKIQEKIQKHVEATKAYAQRVKQEWTSGKSLKESVQNVMADPTTRRIATNAAIGLAYGMLMSAANRARNNTSGSAGDQHRVYGPSCDSACNGSSVHSDIAGMTVYRY
jgi:hypothetical protein